MSKKIPYDTAMKLVGTKKNDSIFIENNPYGYQININHPDIRQFYEEYKKRLGIPSFIALSDVQRRKFESIIFKMIERNKRCTTE